MLIVVLVVVLLEMEVLKMVYVETVVMNVVV